MSKNQLKALGFFIWSWVAFRLISDWPRGLYASGSAMPEYLLNLSYAGLALWLSSAIPAVLFSINIGNILRNDSFVRCNIIFIFWQLFGVLASYDMFGIEGLVAAIYIVLVSISFLLIYIISKEYSVEKLSILGYSGINNIASSIIFCALPSIMIGLWQVVSGGGRDMGGYQRIFGGTSSPNVMAACMLVLLSVVLPLIPGSKNKIFTYGSLISIIAFFSCFSMTGVVAGMISVALYILFKSISEKNVAISPLIGLLILLAIFFFIGSDSVSERLYELDNSDNSMTWRFRTWDSYFYLFDDQFFMFFGGGLGFDHLGVEQEPHNEWLRTMMESGAVGTVLYGFVWIAAISKLWRHIRDPNGHFKKLASGILAGVFGIIIWSFMDSVLRTAPSGLLLFLALGVFSGFTERRGASLK